MRDLSLHLMDIIQNSISAKATKITVSINADKPAGELVISIADNGKGMDAELLKHVIDPFTTTRTTRKIGLGIPLFKSSAERSEGSLSIKSEVGKGTTLTASFKISNIDRPPLGDIAETLISLISADPDIEFVLVLDNGIQKSEFNSFDIKGRLGDVPITHYEVISWIREYIDEQIKTIFGGVLDEINR